MLGQAQELSNKRSKWLNTSADTLALDSLSLIPGSIRILDPSGAELDTAKLQLDNFGATIYGLEEFPFDSVKIEYRVFPFSFADTTYNKPISLMLDERPTEIDPFVFRPGVINPNDGYGFDQLNKSGSISRGIAFGNTQNLSVNSTLNLQLSGKITEDINVMASITDDNLPIQPQGNTQQLQDFDRVFIQLYDQRSKLTAGDFQLKSRTGYFFNYFKRAQGGTFETRIPASFSEGGILLETSAAISKGKFARNQIQGIEGNQGPYRLRGAENERFIIILAGTERVFIDGRLLKRGMEFDYVIDYNTAEIVFTPNQLITKDRRIVVEFQYSDKNYARALLQAHGENDFKNGKVYFTIYNEFDSKNQPLQQELDDDARLTLSNAGDDPLAAVVPSVDSLGFSNNFVQYALRDSLGYDSIFVYSTDPEEAFYRVSFSPVGSGNGDYVEEQFTAVGRVYKWVAPDTIDNVIVHKGDHAAVNILIAPKKQQAFSLGTMWNFGKTEMKVEGAFTVYDQNTFSSLDSQDDLGTAVKTELLRKFKLSPDSAAWGLETYGNYEYVQQNFQRLERFRAVEFERNWNILGQSFSADQHLAGAGVNFIKPGRGQVAIGAESFLVGSAFSGYKGILKSNISAPTHRIFVDASLLNTEGVVNTSFVRHRGELNRRWDKFLIGYKDEHERNIFSLPGDTITNNSYQFYEWQGYTQYGDSTKTYLRGFYGGRTDWRSNELSLSQAAVAEQYGMRFGAKDLGAHSAAITLSNRVLRITNDSLIDQEPESTLLGRIEHRYQGKKSWLVTDMFYEVGSGLEQRREFIYLEVPAGQGVYVWVDYNGDNVKDLNEFEVAQFAYEANYIRSFTPTDQYERVYNNQLSVSARITPARLMSGNSLPGFKGLVQKLSDQASFKTSRKTNRESNTGRFNPFEENINNEALLAQTSSFRNTLFYNRTSAVFGADYTYQLQENKSLLTGGFESRVQEFNQIRLRWNPIRKATIEILTETGRKNNSSDFIDNRNFRLLYNEVRPSVSWQPENSFRLTLKAAYKEKRNAEELGGEETGIQELGSELRYNVATKGSLLLDFNIVDIDYTGSDINNSLGFEMLEGLRPGTNFTWSAGIQKSVSGNIQINLNYNGRKSESTRTVHAGGVQVRAYF